MVAPKAGGEASGLPPGGYMVRFMLGLLLLAQAGCVGSTGSGALPQGASAYEIIPSIGPATTDQSYRIGPRDTLDIAIFQEPELSGKGIEVDAAGTITLPLIGEVTAAGKTASELGAEIAARFDQRYLRNPQVAVAVAKSVSQKVVVQGEVNQPGVYDIRGRATLLESISMARGESKVAATGKVAIFRTIDGQRMGALFDIGAIRRGEAEDPEIMGNDVVVVGLSRARSIWRDVLSAAPLTAVFRPLGL